MRQTTRLARSGVIALAIATTGFAQSPESRDPRDWLGIDISKRDYPTAGAWQAALGRACFDAPGLEAAFALLRSEVVKVAVSGIEHELGQRVVDATNALIDHFVIRRNVARRLARVGA